LSFVFIGKQIASNYLSYAHFCLISNGRLFFHCALQNILTNPAGGHTYFNLTFY